jgi:Response regulators consisting of a CheY-like receiver domain and a winged-helix DNA-binding domain
LILLDIMMPGIDGFSLCLKIRELVDCPILFLTAKTEESSLVNGLSLGADDYICKPFGVMELRARIAAHLRREHREHSVRMVLGRVCFHLSLKQMTVDNKEIPLTKTEYEICEFLARNCGQIFSKEQILEQVFGFDSESNDNTITTHIKNIRLKFSDYNCMPIKTVWGIGYKWEKEEH